MIHVQNLCRSYGELQAVDDVSFAIGRGEVVGLLGPNGAGKTTVMKMLTGYLEPTGGTIRIADIDLETDPLAGRRRIGYLPENCPVWPEMTVIDMLEFHADLHGMAESERDGAVAAAIRRCGLEEKARDSIHTLSRGYRQRAGVAQAILHGPDIVILDEPTNGLDPSQIHHMRSLIRDLARSATVVLSTHILQEVQAVCERVLILRAGRLAVDERLDELRSGGRLVVEADRGDLAEALRAVDGVDSVEPEPGGAAEGRYRYTVACPPENAPSVAAAVSGAGAGLFRLEPEVRSLESVFAEVNATPPEALAAGGHNGGDGKEGAA